MGPGAISLVIVFIFVFVVVVDAAFSGRVEEKGYLCASVPFRHCGGPEKRRIADAFTW